MSLYGNYVDKYKRVSDLETVSVKNQDLLLVTQPNNVGWRSAATTVKKFENHVYENVVKPDIDFLAETKSDKGHKHILKDITDLSVVYKEVAEWIDPDELAEAITNLQLSTYSKIAYVDAQDISVLNASKKYTNDVVSLERINRISVDADLQTSINNEATKRKEADSKLSDALSAEISTRENADKKLDKRIDDLSAKVFSPTYQKVEDKGTFSGTINLDKNIPIVKLTNTFLDTVPFNSFTSNADEDGAYTWELIIKAKGKFSFGSGISYIGNEELNNNVLEISDEIKNYSFVVRQFKEDSNNTWLINYSYSF